MRVAHKTVEYLPLLCEHECVPLPEGRLGDALMTRICSDDYNPADAGALLGLDWGNRSRTCVQAGYFVGMKWVEHGVSAVCVNPKIDRLDVLGMFMKCLDNPLPEVRAALAGIYQVDFDSQMIPAEGCRVELTPFVIAHFLLLLETIVKKGLRRNYVEIEDSLQGRIKGKVCVSTTVKRHHGAGRPDRVHCRYHEFSANCIENRVLNTALEFCERYLACHRDMSGSERLDEKARYCRGAFGGIGYVDPLLPVPRVSLNPFYVDYSEAMRVATWIFRRFGFDFGNTVSDFGHLVPPFHIDMPLLYELYALSLLREAYGENVSYHISTYGNELDFLKKDEKLIIDTKYKVKWATATHHDDVRQLSGYARNRRLRGRILAPEEAGKAIIDCMVIYPSVNGIDDFKGVHSLLSVAEPVAEYERFYRLGLRLPVLK